MSAADQDPTLDVSGSHRPRRIVLFASVALTVIAVDAVSKALVVAHFAGAPRPPVRILWGAIYILETRNSGAAFSLGTGATIVLTLVALAVVGFILRTASRLHSAAWALALALVLGGALGNLADRLLRAPGVGRGHVVDWISAFSHDGSVWPIFNVADSAIVCGAILSALLALRGIDIDGRSARTKQGSVSA